MGARMVIPSSCAAGGLTAVRKNLALKKRVVFNIEKGLEGIDCNRL